MQTVNITNARSNLYNIVDSVNQSHEPIQILGKRGDAVVISAEDWNCIQETLYIMSVPNLAVELRDSIEEPFTTMKNADEVEW